VPRGASSSACLSAASVMRRRFVAPPHLHRRPPGPSGARAARRRDDEPGDHARRGRQGRRDWRGDPSSALLEVLDPAQNHSFRDHYLDVELDLSGVMFIHCQRRRHHPGPLLDRMEVIRFDGYTTSERSQSPAATCGRAGGSQRLLAEEVEISDELLRSWSPNTHVRRASAPGARDWHAVAQGLRPISPRVARRLL